MERTKVVRGLRIAVSAACGILCVLLVVLWVRSIQHRDLASFDGTIAASMNGRIVLFTLPNGNGPWKLEDYPSYAAVTKTMPGVPFAYGVVPAGPYVTTPYWFLVLVSGVAATIPWKPWKWTFSLRTLLIAITALAMMLGLIVYATR